MQILTLIALIIIILIVYFFCKLCLRPAYYIYAYKKQFKDNIYTEFFPHIVSMNPMLKDFKLHKDCYYTYKKLVN